MSVKLETENGIAVVRLEESVDITVATELKQILLEAFQSANAVRVDLCAVAGFDVTAVQLLWAAERHARSTATEFSIVGTDDNVATIASLQEVALRLAVQSPQGACLAEQG